MDKQEICLSFPPIFLFHQIIQQHRWAAFEILQAKRLKGLMRDPIFAKVAFRLKRQRCGDFPGVRKSTEGLREGWKKKQSGVNGLWWMGWRWRWWYL